MFIVDLDKLFEGIYNIQKQISEFQKEMKDELAEVKKELQKVNSRLDSLEDNVEFLAKKQWEHESEIFKMKKRFWG